MDIVRFKGGLGNQMFQYALLKALSLQGREVVGSLGFYENHPQLRQFCLMDVFKNISFDIVDEQNFNIINEQWKQIKQDKKKYNSFIKDYSNRFFWVEETAGKYDKNIFKTHNCTFVGYWQTEKYFIQIRQKLLFDFQFLEGEKRLCILRDKLLKSDNYISIHIRKGDYLNFSELYGNICTEQYYENAMNYMKKQVDTPIFVFFSDDIKWVKEHYKIKNAIYIEPKMFENYQSWYDMCLMSCCTHNIIANSTFSWWGAWLNQRSNKKVVAPKTWINDVGSIKYEMPDICPKEWIRIDEKNNDSNNLVD